MPVSYLSMVLAITLSPNIVQVLSFSMLVNSLKAKYAAQGSRYLSGSFC